MFCNSFNPPSSVADLGGEVLCRWVAFLWDVLFIHKFFPRSPKILASFDHILKGKLSILHIAARCSLAQREDSFISCQNELLCNISLLILPYQVYHLQDAKSYFSNFSPTCFYRFFLKVTQIRTMAITHLSI